MNSYEFRLVVQDMKNLRAEKSGGGESSGDMDFDDLRLATISIFEEWLSQGKITRREELEVLGRHLYQGLFNNQVGSFFEQAFREAQETKQRLCVRLQFQKNADVLSRLPWEYLYSPQNENSYGFWLATNVNLVLARYMPLGAGSISISKPTETLLRILIIISEPEDLVPVVSEPVIEAIDKLREKCPIKIYYLDKPTIENFQEKLQETKPHVLHFIGHGRYKKIEKKGEIALLKPDGKSVEWCQDKTFAEYFQGVDLYPRLVFLHLCQGAQSNFGTFTANFAELAPSLILANIQAVVAMQHPIANLAAINFCRAFYTTLAEGKTIDDAVQAGRGKIVTDPTAYDSRVFGTPVLYMHSSDGIIQPVGIGTELKGSISKPQP